jgi:L-asparaginase II
LAEVTRGGLVESVHHGAVVVTEVTGAIVAAAGDPELPAFFRSSAKPFQAVPLIESGAADAFGLSPAELSLCCSSHDGLAWQQAAVAGILAKIGLQPDALGCGPAPPYDEREAARVTLGLVPPSPLQCDCSGKHAGMLATCLHCGYPIDSYLEATHPLQQEILRVMAATLRTSEADIRLAPDWCSLPTFGAPLRAFALAYATLAAPEEALADQGRQHAAALNRLRAVMAAHPEHIAGPGSLTPI